MSYEIYICCDCGGPIYFPYGNLMHIGTGWDCWKKYHQRDEGDAATPDAPAKFIGKTGKRLLKLLVDEACRRYDAWSPLDRKSRLIQFLRKQLRTGHGDVVHNFFQHLIAEPPKKTGAVVRAIMATPEWHRYARRALRRKRVPAQAG